MSGLGSLLAQLKPLPLTARSLFVKCVPAPRNFFERRAVLAALQNSSGQSIDTFKKLKDNSSFIVVTTNPDAATSLMDNSPLERVILSQELGNDEVSSHSIWGSVPDVSGPIAHPVNPLPVDSKDSTTIKPTPVSEHLGVVPKTFTLHIFPMNADYNHNDELKKNPLHGPWPGDGKTETFMSSALRKVIPPGAMAPALRDWETGNQLARESDSYMDTSRQGAAYMLLGRKRHSTREAFLFERIRRRESEQKTPLVMKSLIKFAEECKNQTSTERTSPSTPLQSTKTKSSTAPAGVPFFDGAVQDKKGDALLNNEKFKKLLTE